MYKAAWVLLLIVSSGFPSAPTAPTPTLRTPKQRTHVEKRERAANTGGCWNLPSLLTSLTHITTIRLPEALFIKNMEKMEERRVDDIRHTLIEFVRAHMAFHCKALEEFTTVGAMLYGIDPAHAREVSGHVHAHLLSCAGLRFWGVCVCVWQALKTMLEERPVDYDPDLMAEVVARTPGAPSGFTTRSTSEQNFPTGTSQEERPDPIRIPPGAMRSQSFGDSLPRGQQPPPLVAVAEEEDMHRGARYGSRLGDSGMGHYGAEPPVFRGDEPYRGAHVKHVRV